ncbi:MAG: 30S ribosomal protein S16 [Candidatus Saccharimonadales bacterium]
MQRTGRSGHAQFRMIVQDSHFHPCSGRVVAYLGNYDPHTKESNFDKEKLQSYLANGAQPSSRVIKLLKIEKIKLPDWVKEPAPKKKAVKFPDKRRSTRPEGSPEPAAKAPVEEAPVAEETTEATAEQPTEESKPETETEQPAEEAPAEPAETPEKPTE